MAARDRQIDRTHRHCQSLFNIEACIVRKPDRHTTRTRCHSIERNGDRLPFATFKRNAFRIGANLDTEIIGGLKAHTIIAIRCIRIGNIEADIGLIAGGHEARHTSGNNHRIADDDIGDGVADSLLCPCYRHDARGAVELRYVESDCCLAVAVEFNRTGEQRNQLFGGRTAFRCHIATIATCAQLAGDAERTIDQATIHIAHFKAQLTLAEEPVFRVRRLIACQIENADIDCRDHDIGLFATRIFNRNRDGKCGARRDLFRRGQLDSKLLVGRIDLQPFKTNRTRRHTAFNSLTRTEQSCRNVGARTPILTNRNIDGRATFRHTGRDGLEQLFRTNGDEQLTGKTRGDFQFSRITRRIMFLVERDFQPVRCFGRSGAHIPARVEFVACGRARGISRFDFKTITTPINRQADFSFAIDCKVNLAVGNRLGERHRLVIPAVAAAIPLIITLDLDQRPLCAVERLAITLAVRCDYTELSGSALRNFIAGEIRTDTDEIGFRLNGNINLTLNRTTAGFTHTNSHGCIYEARC